jgi:hypothetical protein
MNSATVALLLTVCAFPLLAQLPGDASAVHAKGTPGAVFGARIEDVRRNVDAGGSRGDLDMTRTVVTAQVALAPGWEAWGEAGWHEAKLAEVESKGGFTWGAGVGVRPWRFDDRADPVRGPREWAAVRVEAAVRGGSAPVDAGAGVDLEWLLLEGRVGMEWNRIYMGPRRGPIDSTGLTTGAGIFLNQLSAERENFDGDQRRELGIYVRALFHFGTGAFVGLESDWLGSSDRRFGFLGGVNF